MASIQWLKPSPLWALGSGDIGQPWLAEFASDNFIPDFLAMMDTDAASLSTTTPTLTDGKLKLYQPLHGRYYLVTGSLVCRQLGLPDRTVARQDSEKTTFVLRRLTSGKEEGWIKDGPNKGWQPASGDALLDGEERTVLHPVTVCKSSMSAGTGTGSSLVSLTMATCSQRTVYYGYLSVDSRDKYLSPLPDPAAALEAIMKEPLPPGALAEVDDRLSELETRVLQTWRSLYVDPLTNQTLTPDQQKMVNERLGETSLYILLDLGDFLKSYMPGVFSILTGGTGQPNINAPSFTKRKALIDTLNEVTITRNGLLNTALPNALKELVAYLPLVQGEPPAAGLPSDPPNSYNLRNANLVGVGTNFAAYLAPTPRPNSPPGTPAEGALHILFREALAEEKAEVEANGGKWLQVPPEVADMLKSDPEASGGGADIYCIRLAYERPDCPPLLSERSRQFTFARFFDPDAPARHVRIELPSIKMNDLRKYKKGVGMQMSPDLRGLMDRVNADMLKGGGLGPDAAWQLGMICSFSIPIITLVAFIVMFIFLILLNIIFWWLPFLKICFPIPVKKQS